MGLEAERREADMAVTGEDEKGVRGGGVKGGGLVTEVSRGWGGARRGCAVRVFWGAKEERGGGGFAS